MGPLGRRLLVWVAATVLVAACGTTAPSSTPAASPAAPSSGPSPAGSPGGSGTPASSAEPTTAVVSGAPIAASGSIAMLGHDGSLVLIGADGRSHVLADATGGTYGFPTWSPDGSRIATVRTTPGGGSLVVFEADDLTSVAPVEPRVIFDGKVAEPFYLFWTPDSKAVSFLATEAGDLSLRIAPVDGSAPADGSAPGSVIRKGNPFYYDWIGPNRLIAHIGVGKEAFLGEIGRDGDTIGQKLSTPGDFRSVVVSHDQKSIAYVRDGGTGPAEVVVSGRDGKNEHSMDVFGSAAVLFDPVGQTVAALGPTEPQDTAGFPFGPVRLMDAKSGKIHTLIDGMVAIFWWSPDGKTMAALRVQPTIDGGVGPSPDPSQSAGTNEVRLMFVDVPTGKVTSQPVVQLGAPFVNGYVAFFDQYALSHHVWAPDGSSILLPETDDTGVTQVIVRYADGREPIELDGEIAFWSP